jgi:hypothetical protein
LFLGN